MLTTLVAVRPAQLTPLDVRRRWRRPSPRAWRLLPITPYALVFIMLFTACALAVSVISGVLERRRAFALLRASGVRLGQLRRIVILETGVPLLFTVLLGVGVAAVQMLGVVSPDHWVLPSPAFFAGLGAGLLAAFLVSLIAVPFMNTATRLDAIRF